MESQDQEISKKAAAIALTATEREMDTLGITAHKLLKSYKIIAFSDSADYCNIGEDGAIQMKSLQEIGKKSKAIRKVKETTKITESADGTKLFKKSRVEYELYDAKGAQEFLMELRGMRPPEHHVVDIEGSLMAAVAARLGDGTDAKPKD